MVNHTLPTSSTKDLEPKPCPLLNILKLVRLTRFELVTPSLKVRCSTNWAKVAFRRFYSRNFIKNFICKNRLRPNYLVIFSPNDAVTPDIFYRCIQHLSRLRHLSWFVMFILSITYFQHNWYCFNAPTSNFKDQIVWFIINQQTILYQT